MKLYDTPRAHFSSQPNSLNENELIDSIAKKIITARLEAPAILIIGTFKPTSYLFSNLFLRPIAPLFDLANVDAYKYVNFFEKSENLERILNKLENRASVQESKDGHLET